MVSRRRTAHIERMEEDAVILAEKHDIDLDKLMICVDAHDLFRDVDPDKLKKMAIAWNIGMTQIEERLPILLHGKISAEYLRRRFKITDEEILNAVAYHTSGIPTNSTIVMAMLILDSTESGREFEGVEELRLISMNSLSKGYEAIIKNKLIYAITNDLLVLPETVDTWNSLRG